jgi:plasmid stabilization system protein ParE
MAKRCARFSKRAQSWLEREIRYIAVRSPPAAKKLAMRIREARILLTEHPKSAQAGQIHGTRRLVIPPYILTVMQRGGTVEIVAIRHAQQGDAYVPEELSDD